ncbi:hypothetical protein KDA_33730 [Dictyobacter alpinus]|uniref:Uncharacterized protein n=1 Tax=Dictyobacter alpinus TaxID=2014873 RepID=A0A402B9A0_9CHLR|nr:hypothetical protein KDA_33730 [Dictyobacter alpinus]
MVGHQWRSTTAANYRRCDRSQCGAAQRLVGSDWQDVQLVTRKRSVKTWEELEYEMLNTSYEVSLVDADRMRDLKNYWR